jgi:hypothetical protein
MHEVMHESFLCLFLSLSWAVKIAIWRSSSTPTMMFAIYVFLFLSAMKRLPIEAAILMAPDTKEVRNRTTDTMTPV